jgi:hypothetical protein
MPHATNPIFLIIARMDEVTFAHAQPLEPVVPRLSAHKSIFFHMNSAARGQFLSQLPRRATAAPQQRAPQQALSTSGGLAAGLPTPASGLTNPRLLTTGA